VSFFGDNPFFGRFRLFWFWVLFLLNFAQWKRRAIAVTYREGRICLICRVEQFRLKTARLIHVEQALSNRLTFSSRKPDRREAQNAYTAMPLEVELTVAHFCSIWLKPAQPVWLNQAGDRYPRSWETRSPPI